MALKHALFLALGIVIVISFASFFMIESFFNQTIIGIGGLREEVADQFQRHESDIDHSQTPLLYDLRTFGVSSLIKDLSAKSNNFNITKYKEEKFLSNDNLITDNNVPSLQEKIINGKGQLELESVKISQDINNNMIKNNNSTKSISNKRRLDNLIKKEVTVLVYDNIKGYLNWLQPWFVTAVHDKCSTTCIITVDKTQINKADLVVFHAPTHGKGSGVPRMPLSQTKNSIYALISLEQPRYATILNDKKALSNFDILATYSQSELYPGTTIPNLPLSYFPLNIMSIESILQTPKTFLEKTGFGTNVAVALFTSNCYTAGAKYRYEYLSELMKFIKVHSYGDCLNNRKEPNYPNDPAWPPHAQKRSRKIRVMSNYKFYLAFENLPIDDYVSEKVYEGLFAGTISVYRGANSIDNFMPGTDSYINANNMSPQELAALLTKLSDDETLYNNYMNYKKRPIPKNFKDIALKSYTHPNVICRLCDIASSNMR